MTAGAVKRAVWGVGDQVASSLTNFALSFVILRSVAVEDFGAFTIAFSAYVFAVRVGRALLGEPLVIRFSAVTEDRRRAAVRSAVGAAVILGLLAGLVILLIAWLIKGEVGAGLVVVAVVLPGLLAQDTYRFGFFAAGRAQKAFVNDAAWGVVQLVAILALVAAGESSIPTLLLAWGLGGNAAAVLASIQAGVGPDPLQTRSWLSDHRDLGPRFVAELIIGRGIGQVVLYAIGGIAGLAALGSLNGARVLLGPVNIAFLGLAPIAVAEGAQLRVADPDRFRRFTRSLAVGFALVAACVGVGLLFVSERFGSRIISNWGDVRPYLAPVTLWVAGQGVIHAWRVGLRALEAPRESLIAQLTAAPAVILGGIFGAVLWDGLGGAIGLTIASAVGSVIWYRQYARRLSRETMTH